MRPYSGPAKRWLIRAVADGDDEEVESSILNAAGSAGNEALRALAILRAVEVPTSVSRLM